MLKQPAAHTCSLGKNSSLPVQLVADLFTPLQPRRHQTIFLRNSCTEIRNSLELELFLELLRDFLQQPLPPHETTTILTTNWRQSRSDPLSRSLCLIDEGRMIKRRNGIPQQLEKDRDSRVEVRNNCGQLAQLLQQSGRSSANKCDPLESRQLGPVIAPCERCGSPARVGNGFCLNCVLEQGLDCDSENSANWETVIEEASIRRSEWHIGNYQILQEIGRGGMGVVYRARQRDSARIVALKRILSVHTESRERLFRFRREAAIVAAVSHPNILPIYELGETQDGMPFFTMEYAAGGSLLEAAPALRNDPRRIIRLMAKVSRAVHHAHLQGVLHRDLKPGNILLDDRSEPLISDFGLAKSLDTTSDLTRTLTSFGTPGFIAPEQAAGPAKNLTSAADIYSIGAVLFFLLAGRSPFVGDNALTVIKEATEKPAPPLRAFTPVLDRDLEIICAKCLEREPQERYQSAAALAEDLECWLEARLISARCVTVPARIWRWSKRNPSLAGALAASIVLGALNVVAAFTIWYLLSSVGHARLASDSFRGHDTKIDASQRSTEQAENDAVDSSAVEVSRSGSFRQVPKDG